MKLFYSFLLFFIIGNCFSQKEYNYYNYTFKLIELDTSLNDYNFMRFADSKGRYICVLSMKTKIDTNFYHPLIIGNKYFIDKVYLDTTETNNFFISNLSNDLNNIKKVISFSDTLNNSDHTKKIIDTEVVSYSTARDINLITKKNIPIIETQNHFLIELNQKKNLEYFYCEEIKGTYISKKVKSKTRRVRKKCLSSSN